MDKPHKIHVKLGQAEFSAEGSEEVVKEQFDKFLNTFNIIREELSSIDNTPATQDTSLIESAPRLLERAFRKDSNQAISLLALPRSPHRDADALLLLLYGYYALNEATTVMGSVLLRSARQSGISLDRVDRNIHHHRLLVTKAGQRKGARYGLNNRGISKAKELLSGLFE